MSEENRTYELSNGSIVVDERLVDKLFKLRELAPEKPYHENALGFGWNEIGLADLFAELYSDTTRYCAEAKSWFVYHEGVWECDTGGLEASAKLAEFVQTLGLYCDSIKDEETRRNYRKFIEKVNDRRYRDRVMKDAQSCMHISLNQFDAHPYMINCLNGTFDLKTMTFKEHDTQDLLTMQTAFEFGLDWKSYKCDRWEEFIDQVTQSNKEKADFLQRALGYSLLGIANEECMFILYGKTTRNGKSTLLNAIETMLGSYSCSTPVELICRNVQASKSAENASPVLANLKGKRFVTMAESESSGKLDESVIKQYTGGESITARKLYQAPISFTPQFTLWLSCNDLPAVRDKSLFASERLRVIEFDRHFTQAEQDKTLKSYFETPEARKGIFTWLLRGYLKYKKSALEMADEMKEVIDKYQLDNDIVLQFLEENCVADVLARMKAKDLYDTYKVWSKSNSYYAMTSKKFYAEVRAHKDYYGGEKVIRNALWFYGLEKGDD